jgi:hypothetical protein
MSNGNNLQYFEMNEGFKIRINEEKTVKNEVLNLTPSSKGLGHTLKVNKYCCLLFWQRGRGKKSIILLISGTYSIL